MAFEEDANFHAALKKLAAASKCPLVLTCTRALPDELSDFYLTAPILRFARPSVSCPLARLTIRAPKHASRPPLVLTAASRPPLALTPASRPPLAGE